MSFNDEDWKGLTSNLEPGDKVEFFVAFGHGLTVKVTAAYLIYGESVTTEFEHSINMKMELSQEVNSQPSPNVKMEPSHKPNNDIFTRFAKRTRRCLCLI
ncbi:TMV resistance protein N [Trifolium medium]|uniref:TMV resistance protein N n=1 Tax=Trifolium medium TaxID=97028 RepID=A0A392NWZ6_9FABA|nr:TMV resistance protein N [Trifolium medium]